MNWRKLFLVCALSAGWLVPSAGRAAGADAPKTVAWSDKRVPDVEKPDAPMSATDKAMVAVAVCLLLGGGIVFRRQAQRLGTLLLDIWSDPWTGIDSAASRFADKLLAQEGSLAEFFAALRASMQGEVKYSVEEAPLAMRESRDRLQKFLTAMPGHIANLKLVFAETSLAPDVMARLPVLRKFLEQLGPIKDAARFPAMLPLWQLASAMEGVITQLTSNPNHITASVLRTAAGALDLMEALCVPNLRPDLTTNPPVRLMAVDDDPISRHAIKGALKKVFDPPDLANHGKGGLDLVQHIKYDVIFLDVEMPEMDGFELCTKIQELGLNRNTPIVFVTSHSDLDSRARSMLTGAQELIGKPFLSTELALKALTLVIRGRLDETEADRISARRKLLRAAQPVLPPAKATPASTTQQAHKAEADVPVNLPPVPSQPVPAAGSEGRSKSAPDLPELTAKDFAQGVLSHAPSHLHDLRHRLQELIQVYNPPTIQEFLGELFVGVHALNGEAERGELRSVYKLGYALEGMLKKLLEKPRLCTHSTLQAAAAALELLEELCGKGLDPKLTDPPVRLLVVDDDPLARRAICGALQLAFGRPEDAESGEAAVALAAEKAFDLIFMDVMMPGVDGFTACERIHEHELNQKTPVVFVTGQDNLKSRIEAQAAGGCGFIPKPVLSSEIVLTALTHILKARMESTSHQNAGSREITSPHLQSALPS